MIKNKFIEKVKTIHGDKYDYSLVSFNRVVDKIKIICPIHGEFEQQVRVHLKGCGCKECGYRPHTNDIFIKKSKKIHGDKYDYSKIRYNNSHTNVKIICPIHGEFEQAPSNHLSGRGCPKCGGNKKLTKLGFILESKKLHKNKYDYSLVDYKNNHTKIKIICPIHGEFEQRPQNHMSGRGCPKCGTEGLSFSRSHFIKLSKEIHGDKYDYSLVNYVNSKVKVKIICPTHGVFETTPEIHYNVGSICPTCNNTNQTKSNLDFVSEVEKIHGNKYDYSLVDYVNCKTKIKIICRKHGFFLINPRHFRNGQGCSKCSNIISNVELQLKEFIKSIGIDFIGNDRSILLNKNELDVYIPSHKLAIEYNGLYWHSELYKTNEYHNNKTNECRTHGIQLIHIFEDEWLNKKDIVKSRIKNILGLTKNKIYARKCSIKEISLNEARDFMNKNHLQGYTNSTIKLGLFYFDELVSCMLFNKPRKGVGQKYDGYELSRFSNKLNTSVIGGASKLLNFFIKNYKPKNIISYADRRWSQGFLYEKLGFKQTHINKPNYWYIINNQRKHRFNFRKELLGKNGFDIKNKTEREIMYDRGIYKIYDCGTISYTLKF